MTRAALMLLHAILALVFGIGFVLAPATVLGLYRVQTDAAGTFMARLWGAAAIQVGNAAGLAVGFVIALFAQLGGLFNALGWSTVILFLLPTTESPASRRSLMQPSRR